jgi:hypothetical protein
LPNKRFGNTQEEGCWPGFTPSGWGGTPCQWLPGTPTKRHGVVDDSLLEALEDYVKRQRKRLKKDEAAN